MFKTFLPLRIQFCIFLLFISIFIFSCKSREHADLVLYNAVVYTVDSAFSMAEAIAVKDGKIIAVGKTEDIKGRYEAGEIVDAKGKAVYPGFIDAHAHFLGYGRTKTEAGLYDCNSWAEVIEKVSAFGKANATRPWVRGRGWDQNKFPGKEFPDNKQLNELFPDKPVLLQRVDGHAAIANARALELAGITEKTKIAGGEIAIKNGKLTGLLVDNAVNLVTDVIPRSAKAEYEEYLKLAQHDCYLEGVTTVADCGLKYDEVEMVDILQREGKLQMKLYVMLADDATTYKRYMEQRAAVLAGSDAARKKSYAGNGPYKTDRLYVKGVKAYADGALGSRGACLLKPYADKPDWSGFLLNTPAHFDSLAQSLINTDFQLCTHAIGDSGNRLVLNIYAKYLKGKNDKRWRIEHAQVVNVADFHLFGEYSVVPSVQPTHATSDMYWAGDRLGAERIKGAYAYKQLLDENGWLPLGTDFPVEYISPIRTFYAAVTRTDAKDYPSGGFQKENALTREQALRGMTIWAAKSCFMEHEIGSIEPGKKADFVILDRDLMTVPDGEVLTAKVSRAFVGGKRVK